MAKRGSSSLVEVAAKLRRHRRVPNPTTHELLKRVAELRADANTWRQVGAALNRDYTTLYRMTQRWPTQYHRALAKLLRPAKHRTSRLEHEAARAEAFVRLELARLERGAAKVIDAALDNKNPNVALRAANAVWDHFDRQPQRTLTPASNPPEDEFDAEDAEMFAAVLDEFADLPDDDFAEDEVGPVQPAIPDEPYGED